MRKVTDCGINSYYESWILAEDGCKSSGVEKQSVDEDHLSADDTKAESCLFQISPSIL